MAREFIVGSPTRYRVDGRWEDFPIRFKYQTGPWLELFDKHVGLIVEDIERAKAAGKLIMYLSTPIASRGGSYSLTNIEIAEYTADEIKRKLGSRVWILNPVLYQMESPGGTGLIKRHAHLLSVEKDVVPEINIERLCEESPIIGGDYLRTWAKVLIEDGKDNLGNRFDVYYFVGPTDSYRFFTRSGASDLTSGIEEYFARKSATDDKFRAYFQEAENPDRAEEEFLKFYALKAGAYFSLGSHDEYCIWERINRIRKELIGSSNQIPGYFDGRQIGFSLTQQETIGGYALR